jgi:glycosyltransferase involved in cell wall biosynthesis
MENTVSVILPIKTGKAIDFDEYFDKAITSVKNQKEYVNELVIVHVGEDRCKEVISEYDFGDLNLKVVEYDGEPSFATQVQIGFLSWSLMTSTQTFGLRMLTNI